MSDEKDIKEIHGFEVDQNGHHHAGEYLQKHMGEEQFHEMVRNAQNSSDHNSHFMAHMDGKDFNYKIEHHDGKLTIHEAHHS